MIAERVIGIAIVLVCLAGLYMLRDKTECDCHVQVAHDHDSIGRPVPLDGETCCEPDWNYERASYTHERGCQFQ